MRSSLYNSYYLGELQNRFALDDETINKLRDIKKIADEKDVLMEDILSDDSIPSLLKELQNVDTKDGATKKIIENTCNEIQENLTKNRKNMMLWGA